MKKICTMLLVLVAGLLLGGSSRVTKLTNLVRVGLSNRAKAPIKSYEALKGSSTNTLKRIGSRQIIPVDTFNPATVRQSIGQVPRVRAKFTGHKWKGEEDTKVHERLMTSEEFRIMKAKGDLREAYLCQSYKKSLAGYITQYKHEVKKLKHDLKERFLHNESIVDVARNSTKTDDVLAKLDESTLPDKELFTQHIINAKNIIQLNTSEQGFAILSRLVRSDDMIGLDTRVIRETIVVNYITPHNIVSLVNTLHGEDFLELLINDYVGKKMIAPLLVKDITEPVIDALHTTAAGKRFVYAMWHTGSSEVKEWLTRVADAATRKQLQEIAAQNTWWSSLKRYVNSWLG